MRLQSNERKDKRACMTRVRHCGSRSAPEIKWLERPDARWAARSQVEKPYEVVMLPSASMVTSVFLPALRAVACIVPSASFLKADTLV